MQEFKHEYFLVNTSLYCIDMYDKLISFGWSGDDIAEIKLIHTDKYYELTFDDYYLRLTERPDWGMSIEKRRESLLNALDIWGPPYQDTKGNDATVPEFDGLGIF